MATSICATGFKTGGLCSSSSFHGTSGEDYAALNKAAAPARVRVPKPVRFCPVMKNVNEGKGIFAPLVVVTRNIIGKKTFNKLRGKAIALHSQVYIYILITTQSLSLFFSLFPFLYNPQLIIISLYFICLDY